MSGFLSTRPKSMITVIIIIALFFNVFTPWLGRSMDDTRNEKKGTQRKAYSSKKVVRRSPALPPKHLMETNSKFKTPKMKTKLLNVYTIEGAHLQCVNNHCAKFEYKIGVTDYTNQTPPMHFG